MHAAFKGAACFPVLREWLTRLRLVEVFNAAMRTGTVSDAVRLINGAQSALSNILRRTELKSFSAGQG